MIVERLTRTRVPSSSFMTVGVRAGRLCGDLVEEDARSGREAQVDENGTNADDAIAGARASAGSPAREGGWCGGGVDS